MREHAAGELRKTPRQQLPVAAKPRRKKEHLLGIVEQEHRGQRPQQPPGKERAACHTDLFFRGIDHFLGLEELLSEEPRNIVDIPAHTGLRQFFGQVAALEVEDAVRKRAFLSLPDFRPDPSDELRHCRDGARNDIIVAFLQRLDTHAAGIEVLQPEPGGDAPDDRDLLADGIGGGEMRLGKEDRQRHRGEAPSAAAVEEKLANHPKFNEELSLVFKAMGLRRKIEFEDRRAYEKWTSDFGFSPDIVLKVAKRFKKGEIRKLDAALSQYFKLNLLSEREIESFESSKQELLELTREINRIIGYYHPSLELVAEEYVTPWTQKGYDGETLKLIARYCFRRRIQTLEGMNYTVDKFFKLGLLDADAINQYIERLLRYDENIRKLLDNMGVLRTVTAADRKNYALWIEDWQMSPETVEYASTLCSGALNPMSYLNKILSDFKQRGATTPEKAKALSLSPKTEMQEKKARPTGTERNYTAEQLAALFDNLDEIKI